MTGPALERPYKRLSPLTPLVRGFYLVVAFAATSWNDALHGNIGPLGWILLALMVGGAVFGTASWLRTRYWIEADELRVDTGLISQQSRRIRVDRLQGVDIVQPFVARLFGLAELKMDVAGGGAAEGSLAFLPLGEAQLLREQLLARRDAVKAGAGAGAGAAAGAGAGAAVGAPKPVAPPAPDRVLARVDPRMLALSLLLSQETLAFLLSGLVFLGVFGLFGSAAGGAVGVSPLLIGFGLALFRKLSGFWGFTVSQTASGLRVRRGLFELNAQTIALERVQGVVVSEPWLWRPLGWARLDVAIAGKVHGDGDGKPSASTVMPVAARPFVLALAAQLLEAASGEQGSDPSRVPLRGVPERARWVAPVRRHFLSAGLDEHLVVGREGLLHRRTHVVPYARIQSLRISQGPWQRLLGLADLHVDSPPGPVRVRAKHRDAAEARRMLAELDERAGKARRARTFPAGA